MQLKTNKGRAVTLEKDIASGGEAFIWTVRNAPDLVAKIYHKPTLDNERKIAAMVANPPEQPWKHKSIAWPEEMLFQGKNFVGFLMPKVEQSNTAFTYYNPVKRRKLSPPFTWEHLHRTAFNLASATEAIHAKGHIIGDVNESNILVNGLAMVTLVDTDSFQVKDRQGFVHRCTVGKPEYTPPELQGLSFRDVDRSLEHDRFGLAVLIFQLLMDGVHPFSGVLTSQMSVGRVDLFCIKQGLFSYHGANPDVSPPPSALPFAILHPDVQNLFVRCFARGHQAPSLRPSARDWRKTLDMVDSTLIKCTQDPTHAYSSHLKRCPWCHLPQFRQQPSSFSASSLGRQKPLLPSGSQTHSGSTAVPKAPTPKPVSTKRSVNQPQSRPPHTPAAPPVRTAPTPAPKRHQGPKTPNTWIFPAQWTFANIIALVLANLLMNAALGVGWNLTMNLYSSLGRIPTQAILGSMFGLLLGLAQWLMLRQRMKQAGWWILASVGSCATIWGINWQIATIQGQALCGAAIGLAQWPLLQCRFRQSAWWLLVTPLSWTLGKFLSQLILQQTVFSTLSINDFSILSPALQALFYGTLTGPILLMLQQKQKP